MRRILPSPAHLPDVTAGAERLFPVFYDQLRERAHVERLRVRAGETLRTTALVAEAFMKLRDVGEWADDAHFLRSAALAMRCVIVDHARRRLSEKRGRGEVIVDTDALDAVASLPPDDDILALDEALERLAHFSPRWAQVVELRFFGGYTEAEVGELMGLNERSVRRDWVKAKAWLLMTLKADISLATEQASSGQDG